MRCPQCRQDNPPEAELCHTCQARLVLLCPACTHSNPLGSRFCNECGQPLEPPPAHPAPRFASPEAYTPRHLAERILSSRSILEGERKQVTVLFADAEGSLELLAGRDPEDARALLDPILELMMEAVHCYEGTVNQVMGDGIMALFGAPLAHEDHAVRACYSALRMQESVRQYGEEMQRAGGVPLHIRIGIHSGEVVVRSIGNDLHMDYTAVGQTTHLAARLEQMATPGTILLSGDALRLAEGYVRVKPLGAVLVKGLHVAVEAYEVTGTGPVRSRLQAAAARGLTRFVGRQAELDTLQRALVRTRDGHARVVALVGEPGLGKSRLVWEFTNSQWTAGWLNLESGSVSYGKATAYLPVLDLLKGYFKIQERDDTRGIRERVTGKVLALDRTLDDTIPALLALLEALPEDSPFRTLDPAQRREQILEAIRRLLVRESRVQPLLLVFENLHWIDSESQAVLDRLVESLPATPLLLLVTYRQEYQHTWTHEPYYTELRLDPLSSESAEALLQDLLGEGSGLQPLKQLLIERTGGNPFFLEESVRTLVETKALVGTRGAYRLAKRIPAIQVPASVLAVLASRIDRLPAEEKRLLQTAAVIGRDVPFSLLQGVTETEESALRRGLAHLQAAEFLYERSLFSGSEYTFKHALTQEVAYRGLLHERRKALHAKVVAAIERLSGDRLAEQTESLARHALRGEVWGKAVDYLCATGARAYARGALKESIDQYEQALELVPRIPAGPERMRRAIDVRLDLHSPLWVLGQVPRLIQLHQEAEQLARQLEDPPRLGRIFYRMGNYSWMNARYAQSIEYAQQALRIASAINAPDLRISATYVLGVSHDALGEYGTAIELLTRIVEGPDAAFAKRGRGFTRVLSCGWLAWGLSLVGDFERAWAYADRGVHAAEAADHPQAQAYAYALRAIPPIYKGDFAQALPWATRAVHLCETRGLLSWLPTAHSTSGWALAWAGRLAEGLPHLGQGVTLQERMFMTHLSQWHARWAEGLLLSGDVEAARRIAARGLELAAAHGERGMEAEALHVLGEIAMAGNPPDLETAAAYYARAKTLAERLGMRPLLARSHLGLAALHRRGGRSDQARVELSSAVDLFRSMAMTFWLTRAEAERARLA